MPRNSKLYLYTMFHANLNFSYISPRFYPTVIERCYWPILNLVEHGNMPLGLEFSAYTLELLQSLDPAFVGKLATLWNEGRCEFIGSGYVQSIFPLIPARVNEENLRRGNLAYQRLLGRCPDTAFVNEQVFSKGIAEIYSRQGYQNIIVNWESAGGHLDGSLRYHPCKVSAGDGKSLNVIWNSTETYRNFQNYIEDKIDEQTYWQSILTHVEPGQDRMLALYGSDWEILDFKPWQSEPQEFAGRAIQASKVKELLTKLRDREELELVVPGRLPELFEPRPLVDIACAEWPLPFKKQQFFSVTRWAVGGRGAVRCNTLCYRLYEKLLDIERAGTDAAGPVETGELDALWQDLCFLWSSDFRTFTTEDKYLDFHGRMGDALGRSQRLWERLEAHRKSMAVPRNALEDSGFSTAEPSSELRGVAVAQKPSIVVQKTNHRFYPQDHIVRTKHVAVKFAPKAGGSLDWISFPSLSESPLLVSTEQALERHWFSGGIYLRDKFGRVFLGDKEAQMVYEQLENPPHGARVSARFEDDLGTFWRHAHLYETEPRIDVEYKFQFRDFIPSIFRLGRFVLNPETFDEKTLFYETVNGGYKPEKFYLARQRVSHDEAIGPDVTSKGCLGATEGWIAIGDSRHQLTFTHYPGELYSVPQLRFESQANHTPIVSIVFTLGEHDETSNALWRGYVSWRLTIKAEKV